MSATTTMFGPSALGNTSTLGSSTSSHSTGSFVGSEIEDDTEEAEPIERQYSCSSSGSFDDTYVTAKRTTDRVVNEAASPAPKRAGRDLPATEDAAREAVSDGSATSVSHGSRAVATDAAAAATAATANAPAPVTVVPAPASSASGRSVPLIFADVASHIQATDTLATGLLAAVETTTRNVATQVLAYSLPRLWQGTPCRGAVDVSGAAHLLMALTSCAVSKLADDLVLHLHAPPVAAGVAVTAERMAEMVRGQMSRILTSIVASLERTLANDPYVDKNRVQQFILGLTLRVREAMENATEVARKRQRLAEANGSHRRDCSSSLSSELDGVVPGLVG